MSWASSPREPTPRPRRVPTPPGASPLRVDPARLRRAPGAEAGNGYVSLPPPATRVGAHLPVVEETSAGGVVVRPPQPDEVGPQAAVITRRNRGGRLEWCLPKGHLEGEETAGEAAIREVFEETGILGSIRLRLGVIDYWFAGDTRRVHKVVHHFLLTMEGGYLTVENDPDREAEDAFWVPVERLARRLSYPNEQRLAVVASQLLTDRPELVIPNAGM